MILHWALCLCALHPLFATLTPQTLRKFPNYYFIETGTHTGDGVEEALKLGFREIYSIELSPHYHQYASDRFQSQPNIHLILGDSGKVLEELLKEIDAPATFWLDGHYSSGDTARGETNTPLLKELEAIQRHPIKTHTILIDDARLFGKEEFDFIPLSQVMECLRQINPRYHIYFEAGYAPRDILVAKIW